MPVQTAIQVRRGTASSWTSTNPTLAAGEIGFETDTSKFKIGTGSTAWNSLNYFVQDPVTTKGDLYTFSTTDTRLAVGNNGETLVADSSATTGLRWQGNYAAGKNVLINADFRINQRAFTSTTTSATYGFDRWRCTLSGGTVTYSAQTFTAGAAPVAGYEAINYARLVTTSQSASSDRAVLNQLVEDVRTLSGQTVTISFWAQAGSGTPKINVVLNQNFGTGGSASVNAPIPTAQTISTSWARYSFTIANPSVSGKTISATDSRLNVQIYVSDGGDQSTGVGAQNNTFNIWGVQLEAGSVATPFQTATGTLAGELAACQRYYCTSFPIGTAPVQNSTIYTHMWTHVASGYGTFKDFYFPVPMRISTPTITGFNPIRNNNYPNHWPQGANGDFPNLIIYNLRNSGFNISYYGGSFDSTGNNVAWNWSANAEL